MDPMSSGADRSPLDRERFGIAKTTLRKTSSDRRAVGHGPAEGNAGLRQLFTVSNSTDHCTEHIKNNQEVIFACKTFTPHVAYSWTPAFAGEPRKNSDAG